MASSIGKLQCELKQTGIGGGVAVTLGVVATFGILLSPGISIAVAGVGSVAAAVGGTTGILAAVTSKVQNNKEKEKVKKILKEYYTQIAEILRCVNFISANIESLKTYDPSTLKGVEQKAVKMAKMAHMLGDSVGAIKAVSKSSGLTNDFMMGSDMYFSKEDFKLLKKGKLAKQINIVANKMQASLDELMKFKRLMESCNLKTILIQINISAFPNF